MLTAIAGIALAFDSVWGWTLVAFGAIVFFGAPRFVQAIKLLEIDTEARQLVIAPSPGIDSASVGLAHIRQVRGEIDTKGWRMISKVYAVQESGFEVPVLMLMGTDRKTRGTDLPRLACCWIVRDLRRAVRNVQILLYTRSVGIVYCAAVGALFQCLDIRGYRAARRSIVHECCGMDRFQFGFTIHYHYLFPQLTMGLAFIILVLKIVAQVRKDPRYDVAARFWARIFGINFAVGVVTGIPMEFQFGTNWARFSNFAGGVIGLTLAMEGMFAFFAESAFPGAVPLR